MRTPFSFEVAPKEWTRRSSIYPTDPTQFVVAWLIKEGRIRRVWLGIQGQTAPIHPRIARHLGMKQSQGVLILHVETDSPASRAGLREADLLGGFKNHVVGGIDELQRLLVGSEIGVKPRLNSVRHQFQTSVEITPHEGP